MVVKHDSPMTRRRPWPPNDKCQEQPSLAMAFHGLPGRSLDATVTRRNGDEMRLSRSVSAKAALACCSSLTTLALAVSTFAVEATNYMPVSHHLTSHYRPVDPPTAPAPAATGPFWPNFGSYVPAPRKPETDGLSRNPEDCAGYGCIDNGG